MRTKLDFRIVAVSLFIIVLVLFSLFAGDTIGLDPTVTTSLIGVLPGLVVTSLGIIIVSGYTTGLYVIPGFGFIGFGVAILLDEMNATGIIIDNVVADGYTLVEIQVASVIVCLLIGVILTQKR